MARQRTVFGRRARPTFLCKRLCESGSGPRRDPRVHCAAPRCRSPARGCVPIPRRETVPPPAQPAGGSLCGPPEPGQAHVEIPCPATLAGPRGALEGRLVAGNGRNPAAAGGKQDSPVKMHGRSGPGAGCHLRRAIDKTLYHKHFGKNLAAHGRWCGRELRHQMGRSAMLIFAPGAPLMPGASRCPQDLCGVGYVCPASKRP